MPAEKGDVARVNEDHQKFHLSLLLISLLYTHCITTTLSHYTVDSHYMEHVGMWPNCSIYLMYVMSMDMDGGG